MRVSDSCLMERLKEEGVEEDLMEGDSIFQIAETD